MIFAKTFWLFESLHFQTKTSLFRQKWKFWTVQNTNKPVNAHFETTWVSFGTQGVKFCILIKLAIQISSFFIPTWPEKIQISDKSDCPFFTFVEMISHEMFKNNISILWNFGRQKAQNFSKIVSDRLYFIGTNVRSYLTADLG